jgi:hypothetical protein
MSLTTATSGVVIIAALAAFCAVKSTDAEQYVFAAGSDAYRLDVAKNAVQLARWNAAARRFEPIGIEGGGGMEEYVIGADRPAARQLDLLMVQELGSYSIWRLEISASEESASLTRLWSGRLEPPNRITTISAHSWLIGGDRTTLVRSNGPPCIYKDLQWHGNATADHTGAALFYRRWNLIAFGIDPERCDASPRWRIQYPGFFTMGAQPDGNGWLIVATHRDVDALIRLKNDGDAFVRYRLPRTGSYWYLLPASGGSFAATAGGDQPLFVFDGVHLRRLAAPRGAVPVHGSSVKEPLVVVGNTIQRAAFGEIIAPEWVRPLRVGHVGFILGRREWVATAAVGVSLLIAIAYWMSRRSRTHWRESREGR